jgi:hypothetical protein
MNGRYQIQGGKNWIFVSSVFSFVSTVFSFVSTVFSFVNTVFTFVSTVFCFVNTCAANFSFAQLAKRKSLGRSKPQLIPRHKHCNTLCGIFLLYPSLTELPSIEIK